MDDKQLALAEPVIDASSLPDQTRLTEKFRHSRRNFSVPLLTKRWRKYQGDSPQRYRMKHIGKG